MSDLRRVVLLAGLAGSWFAVPRVAVAHGIGGRGDLPVPLEFFLVGAAVVLIVSFVALAVLWPEPRFQGKAPVGRRVDMPCWRAAKATLAAIGILGLVTVIGAGLLGDPLRRTNVAPVLVWVYFWLVIPFLGAVLGDLWQHVNPWRSLAAVTGLGRKERSDLTDRLGVWPATAGFIAFTWFELVWPNPSQPRIVAGAALVYTIYLFYLMLWLGRETALEVGDAFTVYNSLIGSIAPLGHDRNGPLVWRGWMRALPSVRQRRGLTAFVVAMLGTVSYDGLSSTTWWRDALGGAADSIWVGTVGLLATTALIGGAYWLASWLAVRLAPGSGLSATAVASTFAHTLVPIAFAYAFAHYFTLVIFEGQLLLSTMSDPLGRGWNLFGTASRLINFWLSPTWIWYVQLIAIVGGHIAGVVLAHDRSLAVFPRPYAVRSQYAMLGLMVVLTVFGLFLLGT